MEWVMYNEHAWACIESCQWTVQSEGSVDTRVTLTQRVLAASTWSGLEESFNSTWVSSWSHDFYVRQRSLFNCVTWSTQWKVLLKMFLQFNLYVILIFMVQFSFLGTRPDTGSRIIVNLTVSSIMGAVSNFLLYSSQTYFLLIAARM